MSDVIAPTKSVRFTITKVPVREAQRKTLRRLMSMQPSIKRGLTFLQKKRRQHDNKPGTRAGVMWIDRAKATKIVRVEVGQEFTIKLSPQIIADVKSVEKFLDAKPA